MKIGNGLYSRLGGRKPPSSFPVFMTSPRTAVARVRRLGHRSIPVTWDWWPRWPGQKHIKINIIFLFFIFDLASLANLWFFPVRKVFIRWRSMPCRPKVSRVHWHRASGLPTKSQIFTAFLKVHNWPLRLATWPRGWPVMKI